MHVYSPCNNLVLLLKCCLISARVLLLNYELLISVIMPAENFMETISLKLSNFNSDEIFIVTMMHAWLPVPWNEFSGLIFDPFYLAIAIG